MTKKLDLKIFVFLYDLICCCSNNNVLLLPFFWHYFWILFLYFCFVQNINRWRQQHNPFALFILFFIHFLPLASCSQTSKTSGISVRWLPAVVLVSSGSVSTFQWTCSGSVSGGSSHSTPSCTWAACLSLCASPSSCWAPGTSCRLSTASCESHHVIWPRGVWVAPFCFFICNLIIIIANIGAVARTFIHVWRFLFVQVIQLNQGHWTSSSDRTPIRTWKSDHWIMHSDLIIHYCLIDKW